MTLQRRLSHSKRWRLTMAVWAKQSQITEETVLAIAINMIHLKNKCLAAPFRSNTAERAFLPVSFYQSPLGAPMVEGLVLQVSSVVFRTCTSFVRAPFAAELRIACCPGS